MDSRFQPAAPAKVLVIGGTGFLGRAVTRQLLADRHQVRVLVRDAERARTLPPGTKVMVGNGLDQQTLVAACEGADYVVSLLGVRRNQPQTLLEANVDGPRRLGDACSLMGVKGIVYVSSVGAALDPKFRYLSSRFMGEEELRRSNIPTTVLRFGLILGPDGGILRDFERLVDYGPVVIVPGTGDAQFQPIVRDDAARCVAAAVGRQDALDGTLNLGGPEVLTFDSLLDLFMQARGIRKRRVKVPAPLLEPALKLLELYMEDPILVTDELKTLTVDTLADGLDVVPANFGFRPESPSEWIPRNWSQPLAA